MKNLIFALVAVLAVVIAAPALAEDGNVFNTTLKSLGLIDLQQMTDVEGSRVRGKLVGNGRVWGTSVISFQLMDPTTQNFINHSFANHVNGNAQMGGLAGLIEKTHRVEINPAISLTTGTWSATVIGTISGIGSISLTP